MRTRIPPLAATGRIKRDPLYCYINITLVRVEGAAAGGAALLVISKSASSDL